MLVMSYNKQFVRGLTFNPGMSITYSKCRIQGERECPAGAHSHKPFIKHGGKPTTGMSSQFRVIVKGLKHL